MLVGMEFDSKVHRYLVLDNGQRAAPREAKLKVCNSDNVSLQHYYITDRVEARHRSPPSRHAIHFRATAQILDNFKLFTPCQKYNLNPAP